MQTGPSFTLASLRSERMLVEKTAELQATIDTLERRVKEQAAQTASTDRRSVAFTGGAFGKHTWQAMGHVVQAFSVFCSPARYFSSSGSANLSDDSGVVDSAHRVRSRSPDGRKSHARNQPRGRGVTCNIPTWLSLADRAADANQIELAPLDSRHRQNDQLQDHEYVYEGEWEQMGQCSVIYPKSRWKETWDPFILSFILYSAVVVPFRICFDAEAVGFMWDLEVFISLFFTMDVCFNFNTAYPLDDKWVVSRRRIVTKYLSGWFWIDMPSSLPVEVMTAFAPEGSDNSHLSLLRFLRLFRLLRLLRLLKVDVYIAKVRSFQPWSRSTAHRLSRPLALSPKPHAIARCRSPRTAPGASAQHSQMTTRAHAVRPQIEDNLEVNLVSLRILGMIFRLCFMVHLLGCFWFYTARESLAAGAETAWIKEYDGGSAADGPVETQYLYSVYWALTTLTTIGYGDITSTNRIEVRARTAVSVPSAAPRCRALVRGAPSAPTRRSRRRRSAFASLRCSSAR